MDKKIKKGFAVLASTTIITSGVLTSYSAITERNETIKELEQHKNKIEKKLNETIEELNDKNKTIKENNSIIKQKEDDNETLRNKIKELEIEISKIKHFELTYYTDLPIENGGYTTTAIQTELKHGVVASNHYPIGTEIEINGTTYTVEDRGGSEFNSPNRLDVLIERKVGEDDNQYLERVNNMGRTQVKGKIL